MVVAHRLRRLEELRLAGRQISAHFSSNPGTRTEKVKVLVHPASNVVPLHGSRLASDVIQHLIALTHTTPVVDRGHKHSDGTIVACFYVKYLEVGGPAAPPLAPLAAVNATLPSASQDPVTSDAASVEAPCARPAASAAAPGPSGETASAQTTARPAGGDLGLHSQRAQLHRFRGGAWVSFGHGDALLIKHSESGKMRFVFRLENTLQSVADLEVLNVPSYFNIQPQPSNPGVWQWCALE